VAQAYTPPKNHEIEVTSPKSGDTAFERSIYEMGLNALIVVALVFAIFLSKSAHRSR